MDKDFNVQQDAEVSTGHPDLAASANGSLDPKMEFDAWLDKLRPSQPISSPQSAVRSMDHPPADFVVECDEGTNCQISFEGVLHLQGLLTGSIQSESGTLVAGIAIIEGDISVGGAVFIEGSVTGNIRTTESVLLHPGAKVWGDIISRALSVRPGALFQGDCILHENIPRRLVTPVAERAGDFTEQIQGQF